MYPAPRLLCPAGAKKGYQAPTGSATRTGRSTRDYNPSPPWGETRKHRVSMAPGTRPSGPIKRIPRRIDVPVRMFRQGGIDY
jgi:hypothetical protein